MKVELVREDSAVGVAEGVEITSKCREGVQHYNAWVGRFSLADDLNRKPKMDLADRSASREKGHRV